MKFALLITSPPSHQTSQSAYEFARELIAQEHEILRLFFYCDGVYHANALTTPTEDETDQLERWERLIEEYNLDSVVCIAAGLKRGVIDQNEALRHEKSHYNLSKHFELSGLGQLADMSLQADRVMTFGG